MGALVHAFRVLTVLKDSQAQRPSSADLTALCERFLTWLRQPVPRPDEGISVPKPFLVQVAEGQTGEAEHKCGPGPMAYKGRAGGR